MKRWVCHKDKIPKNPVTGSNAMANEEDTWGTYDDALAGLKKFNFNGIGFQFGLPLNDEDALTTERITGIDLDHVIRADGSVEPFALEIIEQIDSYTEISPSGTGIHILCKAKMPDLGRKKYVFITSNPTKFIIEVYNYVHYFTVTGNIFGQAKEIASRTEELKALYEKYFVEHKPETSVAKPAPYIQTFNNSYSQENFFSSEYLSDNELIERMFASKNGNYIRSLFLGDISSHSSHSEADLALVSHLAYWTNGDTNRIDNIFRQSGLMRDKWDERHGAQTYGEKTISKVLSNFEPYVNSFTPRLNSTTQTHGIKNQETHSEKPSTRSNSEKIINTQENVPKEPPVSSRNINFYIHGLIDNWQFKNDLLRFRNFANRKTGFSNIDSHVSFYPGLYVLGAISSLGKTTFVHQMADQLVQAGEHVLFFSLEQTCLEIVTKGISRLMARKNINTAVSAIDIRRGIDNEAVQSATEEYASFTEHEIILECNFATKIDYITETVENYIKETSTRPIIIIDYLQVICPSDPRQQTKDAVDTHVRALKKLQKDNDLVVVIVSSLNRQNYLTPIDYESFKESGGIEYTADVIWGLQLQVINEDIFGKDTNLKAKREKIKQAKNTKPRDIEFVCLKNRYGESNYTCRFQYFAEYDYFKPVDDQYYDSGFYNERL
ncbi:MAG: hypothetical protein IJ859_03050 [Synergistaceae bacterium]|nr:hypothetical protein [Synergistaceae bacterium]